MTKKSLLWLVTIVSAIAFYGLAILGSGGFATFFSHPSLIALIVSGLVMYVVAAFSRGNISSGEREDRSNRWVLAVFTVLGLLAGYLPAYCDRLNYGTIDGDAVRWLGVALFTIGGVFRLYPVFVLGNRFSGLVAIQPGHTLVTTGIYGIIRHPSYLGLLLNMLGWALAFRSLFGVLLAALAIIPLVGRIRAEEKLLHSHFGTEYDDFCAHTRWRLIPGIY